MHYACGGRSGTDFGCGNSRVAAASLLWGHLPTYQYSAVPAENDTWSQKHSDEVQMVSQRVLAASDQTVPGNACQRMNLKGCSTGGREYGAQLHDRGGSAEHQRWRGLSQHLTASPLLPRGRPICDCLRQLVWQSATSSGECWLIWYCIWEYMAASDRDKDDELMMTHLQDASCAGMHAGRLCPRASSSSRSQDISKHPCMWECRQAWFA